MPARIRCHVFEVPGQEASGHDDWLSRRGGSARELLPWADPYIAGLMRRLKDGSAADDVDRSDPFARDEKAPFSTALEDGWQEDAFMPRPLEAPRFHCYPPIYGGFPFLEDAE